MEETQSLPIVLPKAAPYCPGMEEISRSVEKIDKIMVDSDVVSFLDNFKRENGSRCSLIDQITAGRGIDFGPDIEEDQLIHEPSSGEESEDTERSIFQLPPNITEVLN
jgi:hypothetical protein